MLYFLIFLAILLIFLIYKFKKTKDKDLILIIKYIIIVILVVLWGYVEKEFILNATIKDISSWLRFAAGVIVGLLMIVAGLKFLKHKY